MTKHNNPSISEDALRILNFKNNDSLSPELAILTPTIEITRNPNIIKTGACTNATSATIYTTPSDKDFYIVAATFSVIKDATATSTNSQIQFNIDGIGCTLIRIGGLTLTPQSEAVTLSLSHPIKVDRNAVISLVNSTAVGNVTCTGTIIGYTVETLKPL